MCELYQWASLQRLGLLLLFYIWKDMLYAVLLCSLCMWRKGMKATSIRSHSCLQTWWFGLKTNTKFPLSGPPGEGSLCGRGPKGCGGEGAREKTERGWQAGNVYFRYVVLLCLRRNSAWLKGVSYRVRSCEYVKSRLAELACAWGKLLFNVQQ